MELSKKFPGKAKEILEVTTKVFCKKIVKDNQLTFGFCKKQTSFFSRLVKTNLFLKLPAGAWNQSSTLAAPVGARKRLEDERIPQEFVRHRLQCHASSPKSRKNPGLPIQQAPLDDEQHQKCSNTPNQSTSHHRGRISGTSGTASFPAQPEAYHRAREQGIQHTVVSSRQCH